MLRDRLNSFAYAWKGLKALFKTEPNARIHLVAAILVVAAGFFFRVSAIEWAVLVLCIGLVFAAEAFNTSIEDLTDMVSPGHTHSAGRVKDLAAAAVSFTALGAAVAGLLIFVPKLWALLF